MERTHRYHQLMDGPLYRGVVALIGVLCAILPGCKDEIIPAKGDTLLRTMTVYARERNPVTNRYELPAAGAVITIFEVVADGDRVLTTLIADADGIARYAARIPTAGMNIRIEGVYKNQRQYTVPPVLLFCDDIVTTLNFEAEPVRDICCPPPGDTLVAIFLDELARADLVRGAPPGVGSYMLARTLFRNGCPDQVLQVDIPAAPSPFSIRGIVTSRAMQGPRVPVAPGETFTVQFAVDTRDTGRFETALDFRLSCPDGSSAVIRVRLVAHIVEMQCACPPDSIRYIQLQGDPVPVGSTRRYPGLRIVEAPRSCGAVTIEQATITNAEREWSIEHAPLPLTIAPGGAFTVDAVFTPYDARLSAETITVQYVLANGIRCRTRVVLDARACRDMCPLILDPAPPRAFDSARPHAYRFATAGDRVPFSPSAVCASAKTALEKTFSLLLPDSACCGDPVPIDIEVIDGEVSRISSELFTVSPRAGLTLARGAVSSVTVSFTPPTIAEFAAFFSSGRRTATGTVADSTFSIRIRLTSTRCRSCTQDIDVSAIVAPSMQLSPIRNLRAYGQRTDLVRIAPAEVSKIEWYTDGRLDPGYVKSLLRADNRYPYPPDDFDFFVDVRDTSIAFPSPDLPEKVPMLFRVPGSAYSKIQRVAMNYPEQDFARISPVVAFLQADFLANGAYFTRPSLPYAWSFPPDEATSIKPVPGEVYVIYTDIYWPSGRGTGIPCNIALLYVRSRDTGRGQVNSNTHHQSGIEFRLIYPVVLY